MSIIGTWRGRLTINIDNLEVGMVVKNYKKLCELLGEDVKNGGTSKKVHIKEMERYFKYDKKGNSFVVTEIYEEPLPPNNNIKKFLSESYPDFYSRILDVNMYSKEDLYVSSKVIVKWICIICECTFEKSVSNMMKSKSVRCSKCTGSTGEKFIGKLLNELDVYYEKEIKFDGLLSDKGNSLRFDFGIYVDSKLLCIIEYDGQFHDELEWIKYHDKIKDKYCSDNNIPLLRIHHSVNVNDVKLMIVKFVYKFYKNELMTNELLGEISKQTKYKDKLESRLSEINSNIEELSSLL